jgi:hypothetical protein
LTPILPTIPNALPRRLLIGLQAAMVERIDIASRKRDWGQELRHSPIAGHVPEKCLPVFRKGHAQKQDPGAHPDSF